MIEECSHGGEAGWSGGQWRNDSGYPEDDCSGGGAGDTRGMDDHGRRSARQHHGIRCVRWADRPDQAGNVHRADLPATPVGDGAAGADRGAAGARALPPGRGAEPPSDHRGHGHRVQRAAGPPAGVPADPEGHPAAGAGGLRRRALHGPRRHRRAAGHRDHGIGPAQRVVRVVRRGVGRGDQLDLSRSTTCGRWPCPRCRWERSRPGARRRR